MKNLFITSFLIAVLFSCNDKSEPNRTLSINRIEIANDSTIHYIEGKIPILNGKIIDLYISRFGKINNIYDIKDIPKDNWTESADIEKGNGYVTYIDGAYKQDNVIGAAVYARIYIENITNDKYIIQYQFNFNGSETEILLEKTEFVYSGKKWTNDTINFLNKTIFPYSIIQEKTNSDVYLYGFYAPVNQLEYDKVKKIYYLSNFLLIVIPENNTGEKKENTITLINSIGKSIKIKITQLEE